MADGAYHGPAVLPSDVTTVWANGLTSEESTEYDLSGSTYGLTTLGSTTSEPCPLSYGRVTRKVHRDFRQGAAGPILDDAHISYKFSEPNSPYLTANMLDLVGVQQIFAANATTPSASTTYGYDEPNWGPQGTFGNLTSVSQSGNAASHTSYRSTGAGMPQTSQDPNGNTTTYTYDSTGMYLSSVQQPTTNGIQHIDQYSIDSNTGNVNSHTDQTNQITTYYHNDPLARLKKIVYPPTTIGSGQMAQGETDVSYDDSAHTVTTTVISTPNPSVTTVETYDSLGRLIAKGVSGGATVETRYDLLGRVASVSTPHLSGQSADGSTLYSYDALGRIRYQCQPDNGSVSPCISGGQPGVSYLEWKYTDGSITTFYDEVRNTWQRQSDTEGRLIYVTEKGNATNPLSLLTQYGYNTLGNLTSVMQSGAAGETTRSRSFSYDSLSRLITANNPETGMVCYGKWLNGSCVNGYDSNGNLQFRTASNITTSYSYDALNRLTGKTYSGEADTAHPTMASCYLYDSEVSGGSNTKGRLVSEWTQPGNCPSTATAVPSSAVSWKDSLSYDAMGRVVAGVQCAFAPCSSPNSLVYVYDLAGNITYSVNGLSGSQSPQVAWTNSYDIAGRLSKVASSWTDVAHPAVLFEADRQITVGGNIVDPYGPYGLTGAQYGVNATDTVALSEARSYDFRGRLMSKSVFGASAPLSGTVAVSMNPATFDLTSVSTMSMHVNCNSACGQVDIQVDTIDLGPQPLNASGNVTVSSSTFPASALSIGSHTVTVQYLGSGSYAPSSSSATYTVTGQQTTVEFSMNPATFTTGENSVVAVHVGCNSACGQAVLTIDGHQWIPLQPLDGSGNTSDNTWWWPSPYLTPGVHTAAVNYLGNSTYAPTSSNNVAITVSPVGTQQTTATLSMSQMSFTAVEDAVASVHVGCNSSCGQVQFTIDGNQWVTWPLDANGNTSADTYWWPSRYFTQGAHTLTANYLGNSTFAPSPASQIITVNPIGTQPATVALSMNQPRYETGDTFVFPVHVGCNSACGLVEFTVDGNLWTINELDQNGDLTVCSCWAGTAYFTPDSYDDTTHTVTAHFLGNSTYAPVDSSVTVTVGPAK
jgi:YD repeat-containing protein